ncbi:AraC family transcriptional regulator [Chitinophaga filiformis]|uniref:helix-turn-helix transcriptional regulator n=1 Tax=Chitinophaga filiformis TaxID=104663 RepID=UPI001F2D685B|nr:AraC family transcriptional regulator [Chitinophaga filiformis]MCF6403604.1 AraC family transcriptional regulator [Chitinophaga filiformis]
MKLENGKYLGNNSHTFHMDGLIVSKTTYHEKVFEGWHFHENNHLSFILEGGNREYRKNGEETVLPGSIRLYHSGEWHRNSHTQHPSQNINLEIEDSFLSHYEASFTPWSHSDLHTLQTRASLTAIKIYHDCLAEDQHSHLSIHQQVLSLLQGAGNAHQPEKQLLAGRASEVATLLHDRWNENISLQDLVAITQLHPVTVSRHFSAYFRCSLGEYMRKIRVQKALTMIRQTEEPLTGIAYQCGFFDQSHFIRAFREQTGFLPKAFRKL